MLKPQHDVSVIYVYKSRDLLGRDNSSKPSNLLAKEDEEAVKRHLAQGHLTVS